MAAIRSSISIIRSVSSVALLAHPLHRDGQGQLPLARNDMCNMHAIGVCDKTRWPPRRPVIAQPSQRGRITPNVIDIA